MQPVANTSPIVISAQTITLTARSASDDLQAAATSLQNPFREAMVVDEFRFHARGSSVAGGNVVQDALRVGIRCGRQLLTATRTPVSVICKARDANAENFGFGLTPLGTGGDVSYVWRLDKALYLPMDGRVDIDVTLVGADLAQLSGAYTIDIAMAGRSLPSNFQQPKKVFVPYAAKWLSPVVSGAAGAGVVQLLATSQPSDLRNIHQEPLIVTRFTGLVTASITEAVCVDGAGAFRDAQIMLYKHDGELGLRDQSPPFDVLAFPTRSWVTKNAILEPNGYFIADVNYTPVAADIILTRLLLGMVGYHEIDIEDLGVPL